MIRRPPRSTLFPYTRSSDLEKELLLSWCRSRPSEEKERLARAYADRVGLDVNELIWLLEEDRKSTRLNSSHANISYAVFCLKKQHRTMIHDHLFRPVPDVTP